MFLGAICELLHPVLISIFEMIGNPRRSVLDMEQQAVRVWEDTSGFILDSALRNYSCFLEEPDEEPDEGTEYRSAVCKTSVLSIVLSLSHIGGQSKGNLKNLLGYLGAIFIFMLRRDHWWWC